MASKITLRNKLHDFEWVKKKLNPDQKCVKTRSEFIFKLDWMNKIRTWLKKLISDTTSLTESLSEIKFNALNLRCWIKKFCLKNNFLKLKNADKNSRANPFRKNFWILTFWIFFVLDFYKLDAEFLNYADLKLLKLNLTD